ncbi:MAG: hypothetical protein SA339_09590 [Methanomassiliicoccus sp.]|nr:hypothetical protein [Methanomassiliicoccus sp.]
MFIIMFLLGFFTGYNGSISETYSSWFVKIELAFIASILMLGLLSGISLYASRNIDLGMVSRTNADQYLWMSSMCYAISAGIGFVLLLITNPDTGRDSMIYGLYGGMMVMILFGILTLGIFTWFASRNLSRLIDEDMSEHK